MRWPSMANQAGRGCCSCGSNSRRHRTTPAPACSENSYSRPPPSPAMPSTRRPEIRVSGPSGTSACARLIRWDKESSSIPSTALGDRPIATSPTLAPSPPGNNSRQAGKASGHWQFSIRSWPALRSSSSTDSKAPISSANTSGFSQRTATPEPQAARRAGRWAGTGAAMTRISSPSHRASSTERYAATGCPRSGANAAAAAAPRSRFRPTTPTISTPADSRCRARNGPNPFRERPAPTIPPRSARVCAIGSTIAPPARETCC